MAQYAHYASNGFPLGLNWSRDAESIADTELITAENCEYTPDDGGLSTVPGLDVVLTLNDGFDINSLWHDRVNHAVFFSCGSTLYRGDESFNSTIALGDLTGKSRPRFALFGNTVLVASGGQLQYVSDNVLAPAKGAPECDGVFVRYGRVVVYGHKSPVLTYSAIGDYQSWGHDTVAQGSSGAYAEVGYKDVGNILSIAPLAAALVVCKEDGKAYMVSGLPANNDYMISSLSETAYIAGNDAAISVNNKIYMAGLAGFTSLVPSQGYENIAPFDEGININGRLSKEIVDNQCRLYHLPSRKQIWIRPAEGRKIYIYSYVPRHEDGRGVFTTRVFAHPFCDVVEIDNEVYVAYGNKIARFNENSDKDDGEQIVTHIVSKNQLPTMRRLIVMNRNIITSNRVNGIIDVKVGKKTKTLPLSSGSSPAAEDNRAIADANESIAQDGYLKNLRPSCGSNRSVQAEITVKKGAIALRQLEFDVLEV